MFRRNWPKLDVYGTRTDRVIRRASAAELERLMRKAVDGPWSVVGRSAWLQQNKDRVQEIQDVVFGTAKPSPYRRIAVSSRDAREEDGRCFTPDVSRNDLEWLVPISQKLVTLAHRYISRIPHLDLEPDQNETWRRPQNPA
jgi:hypothetical protein